MYKYIFVILLLSKIIMANDNYLEVDNSKQKIEICDKFGWCKIYDKDYLRKFQFVVSKDKKFLTKGIKGPVYFYRLSGNKKFHGYSLVRKLNSLDKKILIKKNKPNEFISLNKSDEINTNEFISPDKSDEVNTNEFISLDKSDEVNTNYFVSLEENDEVNSNYFVSLEEIDEANSNYFVSLGMGTSKYNINSKDNINYLHDSLEDTSKTFDLSMGYIFNEDYFATMNLQSSILPNMKFIYLYSTFNYDLDTKVDGLNTYLGLIGGYGISKWNKSPVAFIDNNKETKSIVYGLQLGSNYEITQKYSLSFELKHIRDNFETKIDYKEAIEHAYHTVIILGVRYEIN